MICDYFRYLRLQTPELRELYFTISLSEIDTTYIKTYQKIKQK